MPAVSGSPVVVVVDVVLVVVVVSSAVVPVVGVGPVVGIASVAVSPVVVVVVSSPVVVVVLVPGVSVAVSGAVVVPLVVLSVAEVAGSFRYTRRKRAPWRERRAFERMNLTPGRGTRERRCVPALAFPVSSARYRGLKCSLRRTACAAP
ncbi:hypothetical protein [Nannocystis pusilla]|uniref:hypothetical protein n=1 Tax=Nannocystis pusilla TaxID=889268 RepID=UPI003B7BA174